MSIASISTNDNNPADVSLLSVLLTSPDPSRTAVPAASGPGDGAVFVSRSAQFLNRLQQLKQSDPAKFQADLTTIADKLQAAAQQSSGSRGQELSTRADKFRQAAQTGSLSSLEPARVHGSHHRAVAAYRQATAASSAPEESSPTNEIIGQTLTQNSGGILPAPAPLYPHDPVYSHGPIYPHDPLYPVDPSPSQQSTLVPASVAPVSG